MNTRPLVYSPSSGRSAGRPSQLQRLLPRQGAPSRVPVSADVLTHTWPTIREQLRAAVDESAWDLWLAALEPRSLQDGTLVIEAPEDSRDWVRDRYGRLLEACASA